MLEQLVNLYRNCVEPRIDKGTFYGQVKGQAGGTALVEFLSSGWDQLNVGRMDDLNIDGRAFEESDEIPNSITFASFTLTLSESGSNYVCKDVAEMVSIAWNDLSRGLLPREYYLWGLDLYTSDTQFEHPQKLKQLSIFIESLAKLAHHHDDRRVGAYKLLFVAPSGQASRTSPIAVLSILITNELVDRIAELDIEPLSDLAADSQSQDIHFSAKRDVFRTAFAEYLREAPSDELAFQHVVVGWDGFVTAYQRDFATYLSGFSFHKARREVANAQMDIASKFSTLSAEIGAKALGVPVAVVAILAFPEVEITMLTASILVVGMALASVILFATMKSQERQFQHICEGKKLTLESLSGDVSAYPPELVAAIETMSLQLEADELSQSKLLKGLKVVAWAPIVTTLVYLGSIMLGSIENDPELVATETSIEVQPSSPSDAVSSITSTEQNDGSGGADASTAPEVVDSVAQPTPL